MTTFPGSPKTARGALIGLDLVNPLASVIVFQYNPDEVTRTVTANASSEGGSPGEQLRLKGPPSESISFTVEVDAVDQLERGDALTVSLGLTPVLASFELLLYPKSPVVIANSLLAAAGLVEVVPMEAPLAVLVWGPQRVLPVRLNSFTITEEAFDPGLNPIRAKVGLDLKVLTYEDLGLASAGGALFLAHQITKEAMATINSAASLGDFSASASLGIGG
ncbi:MAG: hypothetical protein L0H79_01380 [Intrasporangium sp.]|uniref:hypothetical protein n=1 Tax=Intrasporangium sp. TaxID=1925024 RepID=UPI002648B192|nr:hypothetical protein [Intrasporangium sp.]MDN5794387.1 hypothetical protein [Intrasporangium sp.]